MTQLNNGPITPTTWHTRGYLPHYSEEQHPQLITFRLLDSLPKSALVELAEELELVPPASRNAERFRRIEQLLDRGAGECLLANDVVAGMIEENLLHFDRRRYRLHAWVVMPNHLHILFTPGQAESIVRIVHSWKSYTAKRANETLGLRGAFWQREYFDRMIRNDKHFAAAFDYIHDNPVKAGLCKVPTDWRFSSARFWQAHTNN